MGKWQSKRKEFIWETIENPIFIFCGGEQTEPNYFEGFKNIIENNAIYKNVVKIEIIKGSSDTIRILEYAINYIKNNNIKKCDVWCVFDKDDFLPRDFNNAIYKSEELNKSNEKIKYYITWSNECIELWFLLHFCYYTSSNGRKDYIDRLNDKFKELKIEKYAKNNKQIFNILLDYGNPKNAISNAKRLELMHIGKTPAESVPCTKVHNLVEALVKYLPDEIKERFI